MAQGLKKVAAAKKSAGSKKRKAIRAKTQISKGRRTCAPKGRKAAEARENVETTKAINAKNEVMGAARAVGAGDRFFLNEIKEHGTKELAKQYKARDKNEHKEKKLTERLTSQLKKLKGGER
mmetsp:Transcript_200/g.208  ORF Transcript_200/g.208 Transcript_200/m.208 type:complete len:122 (-) Transcript_200:389-754(-)|eukprot:CAMPEP_0197833086 /NCGR_PEP_ID=MMETSP1437-20131217/17704_1 /TAXON_ID=49252 ORGANISM="Eucampia antarctica, Strain CCMP1452" /NCGR_SAMPLE_ID=MMETSP1437 /ASSEMBLY_ACC=CAM_ASM_001096 /LENGTH=121 /DNA_ID=CAMNT_0043436911 /DNA_START=80 /DNA_END=445 /DNA_ORIENTATION=+